MIEFIGEKIQGVFLWLSNLFTDDASEFKSPGFLWLLLLLMAFLVWYEWWYSPRRLVVPMSYDPHKLVKPGVNLSWLRFIPFLLTLFGVMLLIIAMARPIAALHPNIKYAEGIDIIIALDASGSMDAQDYPPNRLEAAKEKAIEFIEGREFDRIGIVLFGEEAFTYAPLTLDYDLLKEQINSINKYTLPRDATAVGSAIAVSINRLEAGNSPSQIIILLTDGSNNAGEIDPLTAAEMARDRGIKIYAIGIGSEETENPFAFFGAGGPDSESLEQIAKTTGGQFFLATNEDGLKEIFARISTMEKTEVEMEDHRLEKDVYPPLLLWGGAMLLLSFLLMITFFYNPLEG